MTEQKGTVMKQLVALGRITIPRTILQYTECYVEILQRLYKATPELTQSLPIHDSSMLIIPACQFPINLHNFAILLELSITLSGNHKNKPFIIEIIENCEKSLSTIMWLTPIVERQVDLYLLIIKACLLCGNLICMNGEQKVTQNAEQALPYYDKASKYSKEALILAEQLITPIKLEYIAACCCNLAESIIFYVICGGSKVYHGTLRCDLIFLPSCLDQTAIDLS